MNQMIYLDYAAATPMDSKVVQAMQPYFSDVFYNPSASYLAARQARMAIDEARAKIAHYLGVHAATEIIFTAGGTEANNLAIAGVMSQYPDANLVVSAVEHESVLVPAGQFSCKLAPVQASGRVDVAKLAKLIDDKTVLVSVMQVNNEVGTIQPLREISKLLAEVKAERKRAGNKLPVYFHTDAAQAGNYLDLHMERLGVDMLTLNGGKIYGPKQSGVLAVKSHVKLRPLLLGGGQERALRSGTENVAAIVGLSVALEIAQTTRVSEAKRLQELQAKFIKHLQSELPEVVINGSLKVRVPNNVHITLSGQDNERLIFGLDDKGILAAAGSACTASNEEPSHVLRAMGVSEKDAQSSLRFTMGRTTDEKSINRVVEVLKVLYNQNQ